jgi:hypothetical protein
MRNLDELQRKSVIFHERFKDEELDLYLASLEGRLKEADVFHDQLGRLLREVQATVADPVRPPRLKEVIAAAEALLRAHRCTRA